MKISPKIKDIKGQKFGKLTAIRFIEKTNYRARWLFKCDCGNSKIIESRHVIEGSTNSCGCLYTEHARKLGKKFLLPDDKSYKNRIYRNYKRAAKKRGIVFHISKEYFSTLMLMNCYYCGDTPNNIIQEGNKDPLFYSGVDRKDNELGYYEENSVPCCGVCNKMKMNLKLEDFLNQIKKIMQHRLNRINL